MPEQLSGYKKSAIWLWAMIGTWITVVASVALFTQGMNLLNDELVPGTVAIWYVALAVSGAFIWAPLLAVAAYGYEELRIQRYTLQQAHGISHREALVPKSGPVIK